MLEPNQINPAQRQFIEEIERNEMWLLGERLGRPVVRESTELRARVVEIVLQCREQWRASLESRGTE